jgi:hypothetical protein
MYTLLEQERQEEKGLKNAEKDCFIVVAQIGDGALVAVRALEDAGALPMPQHGLMEIVDDSGILRNRACNRSWAASAVTLTIPNCWTKWSSSG